jgi:copper(I)-binding protein
MHSTTRSRLSAAAAALTLLTGALTGCGSDSASTSSTSSSSTSAATSSSGSTAAAAALTITDAWCKSSDSMAADMASMTGCFGTLHNSTDAPIHITGGSSPAAGIVQLHETVKNAAGEMQMQEAKSGFTVPAKGTFALAPGANHVMLMELAKPLDNGTSVSVSLTTDAGEVPVDFAVRTYAGGNEPYSSGSSSMSMSSS